MSSTDQSFDFLIGEGRISNMESVIHVTELFSAMIFGPCARFRKSRDLTFRQVYSAAGIWGGVGNDFHFRFLVWVWGPLTCDTP